MVIFDILIVAASTVFGACWRRIFGGWRPFGVDLPRAADLVIYVVFAALVGLMAFIPHWFYLALAALTIAFSWTPAHGPDTNRYAYIKNDWVEQTIRYGLFPGLATSVAFLGLALWIPAAVMLLSGILAGLAAAFFVLHGDKLKWLPVDYTPHSFADGRMIYNEFALGAIISGGFALACVLA